MIKLLAILGISGILASSTPTPQIQNQTQKQKNLTFEKTQTTNESHQQNGPIIYDNTIIWTDFWSNPIDHSLDIWGYSFETGQKFPVITRLGDQRTAAINKNYILYSDLPDYNNLSDWNVRLYNRETGEDFAVAEGTGNQMAVDMSGSYAIYQEGSGSGDLYAYNLNNKKVKFISHNVGWPRIWGHKIVWTYANAIQGYDLGKNEFFEVVANNGTVPDISKDKVVWGQVTYPSAIFYKDLNTGIEKKIVNSGSWPKISEKFITWVQDDGIGAHNIYAYDLRTGQTVQVSNDGPQQPSPTIPDIWKNTIVWMSWHTGNGDVYSAKLFYE